MTDGPVRFDELRRSAKERWGSARKGKTRLAVQVGHCSRSAGAAEVGEALVEILPESAYLVVSGCDGACYDAPTVVATMASGEPRRFHNVTVGSVGDIALEISLAPGSDTTEVNGFFAGQHRITLDGCGELDSTDVDDYVLRGGYAGLARALDMTPEDVIEQVNASGLHGRGGAYFPAAIKWRGARGIEGGPRYLVVNCEEGEPGVFKDRHLMEGVPHRILEGAAIAAYASGVDKAYVYVNAEANLSAERLEDAIAHARDRNLLGDGILGSGFGLDVEVLRGAGGYVCGEETTLLNTMEGYRREPRVRPPFPTESGLWARPTVINNAETLASVPYILANGPENFAGIGTEREPGTKLISLSGSVRYPGVVEVPMGTTLRRIIDDIGGGPQSGRTINAVAVGGPSSGILPPSMLDTPVRGGALHDSGVMLGAGGVIVLDDRVSVVEMLRGLAAYNSDESCGKCTPCREGTPRMVEVIDRLASGRGTVEDMDELRYLAEVVNAASLCGLGQAAGNPALSALHFFGDELSALTGAK